MDSKRVGRLVPNKKISQLVAAAEAGDTQTCLTLLDTDGVDVNGRDDERFATALMRAASQSYYKLVDKFLSRATAADVTAKDNLGWTALHWVCWGSGGVGWFIKNKKTGRSTIDTFRVLLEAIKKNPNYSPDKDVNASGHTPLMMMVKYFLAKPPLSDESSDSTAKLGQAQLKEMRAKLLHQIESEQREVLRLLTESVPSWRYKVNTLYTQRNAFGQTLLDLANDAKLREFLMRLKKDCDQWVLENPPPEDAKKNKDDDDRDETADEEAKEAQALNESHSRNKPKRGYC